MAYNYYAEPDYWVSGYAEGDLHVLGAIASALGASAAGLQLVLPAGGVSQITSGADFGPLRVRYGGAKTTVSSTVVLAPTRFANAAGRLTAGTTLNASGGFVASGSAATAAASTSSTTAARFRTTGARLAATSSAVSSSWARRSSFAASQGASSTALHAAALYRSGARPAAVCIPVISARILWEAGAADPAPPWAATVAPSVVWSSSVNPTNTWTQIVNPK